MQNKASSCLALEIDAEGWNAAVRTPFRQDVNSAGSTWRRRRRRRRNTDVAANARLRSHLND